VSERFDAEYYARFYGARPVHTRRQIAHLAAGVTGLLGWWRIPVRSVLDVGAGPGYWRDWFGQHRPTVRYRGIDISTHACERYGHEQRDIATWAPRAASDLVVCQGVLQYLDDTEATAAIGNLAAAARHVLYLEVPTRHDREHVIDAEATDLACHWRTGDWYRRRLVPHFTAIGAGLWARRDGGALFYELEVDRRAR
jgi:trans-aconitate methyltransferase